MIWCSEGGWEKLHDKDRNTRALLEVDSDKVHNVWVSHLGKQLALFLKAMNVVPHSLLIEDRV